MSSPSQSVAPEALAEALGELSTPVEVATVLVTLAVLVLGAYVGYQAYRGYSRNGDRAVLFLGIGVALVTTGRQLASLAVLGAGVDDELLLLVVFFGVSIAGLAAVLYAFLAE